MTSSEDANARATLTSAVVALFLESLLFGALVVIYCIYVWSLFYREPRKSNGCSTRNALLLTGTTIMLILTFVHVVLDVHVTVHSFVTTGGVLTEMSSTFDGLNGLSSTIGTTKFSIYVKQTLIGDGFMIYRAYVVWDRYWSVTFIPLVLLAGELGLGYYISFFGPMIVRTIEGASHVDDLVHSFFILSFATNMLVSALIMRRILSMDIPNAYLRDTPLRNVRWRVVESILQSAAVYSIASVVLAVTSFVSPTIAFAACHSVFPSVISIAFVIVVMRICANARPRVDSDLPAPQHSLYPVKDVASSVISPVHIVGPTYDWRGSRELRLPQSPNTVCSLPIAIHVSVSTTSDDSTLSTVGDERSSGA